MLRMMKLSYFMRHDDRFRLKILRVRVVQKAQSPPTSLTVDCICCMYGRREVHKDYRRYKVESNFVASKPCYSVDPERCSRDSTQPLVAIHCVPVHTLVLGPLELEVRL